MKKLPTSLRLFGQKITVEQIDNFISLGDRFADWDLKTNHIRIQTPGQGNPDDVIFEAFFHEVFHAMCDLSGHTEWSANEQVVELFGQMMYQAEQSRRY